MRRDRDLIAALGGSTEVGLVRAPGRVNLIGDHTDYNEGFVLPLAIDRECTAAWRRRDDGRARVRSFDADAAVTVAADGSDDPGTVEEPWGRLVAGIVRILAERGRPPIGFEIALTSTVPLGSGLSSSAAFEVAIAWAAVDAARGFELDRRELARVCRDAEQRATGVPCGLMDQLASLFGQRDHALLIDCRTLSTSPVPLPAIVSVLVVHTGVARALAASAYAERRAACEAAAVRLRVPALRDAHPGDVADDRWARHVVSENQRVLDAVAALRGGDLEKLGAIMLASHASLRDDFEVSTRELDLLVELLMEEGAIGARLTGGGFGGCVVGLVGGDRIGAVAAQTAARYRQVTGLDPTAFAVRAVDGARGLAPGAA
ncbi:MAG: galactokinase [Acidimicrobiia bacterium]